MAGKRLFAFKSGTIAEARVRQAGLCAHCGEQLIGDLEYGHHVVPDQCGDPTDPAHAWLKTALNCVVLCHHCHQRAHQDGRTQSGAVAPPKYFKHSHASRGAHSSWVATIDRKARPVWKYVQETAARSTRRAEA